MIKGLLIVPLISLLLFGCCTGEYVKRSEAAAERAENAANKCEKAFGLYQQK